MLPVTIGELQAELDAPETAQDPFRKTRLLNRLARAVAPEAGGLMRAIAYCENALELASTPRTQTEAESEAGVSEIKHPASELDLDGVLESLQNLSEFYSQVTSSNLILSFVLKTRSFLDLFGWSEGDQAETLDVESQHFCAHLAILLGKTFSALGDYSQALEGYLRARDVFHRIEDSSAEAETLNNIGQLYLQLDQADQALQYLSNSFQTAQLFELNSESAEAKSSAIELQANVLDNLCRTYLQLSETDKALGSGLLSVQLFQQLRRQAETTKLADLQRGEARALNNLGWLYLHIDAPQHFNPKKPGRILPWSRALATYQQAYNLVSDNLVRHEKVVALLGMGETFYRRGEYNPALACLHQARELATGLHARREQYEIHLLISKVYKEIGDFAKALEYYEQYHTQRDQAFDIESTRRLRNLELVHQLDNARKETEISQLRNITLQKEIRERLAAEKLLTETNLLLQDEIHAKEQLINDLNAFAHMVAHDLKSPLTNMSLSTGLVRKWLDKITSNLQPETAHGLEKGVLPAVEKISDMVSKMNRIINELLVLASVRNETVQLMPLDMGATVAEVEERLSYLITEFQAEIRQPAVWPKALGHAPWVEEIWANYISNAIAYGGRPPQILLGADELNLGTNSDGTQQRFVRFWVQDNGRGLTMEQQGRLFTEFGRSTSVENEDSRVQEEGKRPKSHGLGLSIVKRIADRLSGAVGVESEGIPGQGARFYFTLPANEE